MVAGGSLRDPGAIVTTVAALDCGTNALRILIMRGEGDESPVEILREMRTVRLGEGVDATGELSPAALQRTFVALDEYRALMEEHGVERARMVATSATRDARNRAQFVEGVHARIGVVPEVITGDEEAKLSFQGAVGALLPDARMPPYLVADIGGGSTEFVRGGDHPDAWVSVDIGCVRMTERHLHGDPPTAEEIRLAENDIAVAVAQANMRVDFGEATTFVGLAGSVTTVAAYCLDLSVYDPVVLHGSVVSREEVERATDAYLAMTRQERAALAYMHPGRVDVIAGGAMVLREIMRQGSFERVVVSENDLLDGIAYSLL